MITGMNLWDTGVWSFVVTITILFSAMMLANILRNTVKFIRRLMIPSAVVGGFIILVINFAVKELTGTALLESATLEMLTYHGLGLGFVAMALRNSEKQVEHKGQPGGFDSGATVVGGYLLQAAVGLGLSLGLYKILGGFFASGLLLPMGYGQGPGQAYNWGKNYENLFGFEYGTSFGLTVAAMGCVAASVGGIIYLNRMRRKGLLEKELGGDVHDEELTADKITGGNEIPLSESMDKFTVQLALVFIAYTLAYLFMYGINCIIETGILGNFGVNTVQPLIWGFNFLIGTLFALLLKAVLKALQKKKIIKREYCNNFMLNRISGFMFDIMVVASIAAINLSAFAHVEFIVPLILLCVLGAVVTYIYLDYLCKHIYKDFRHEAFLSLYGMQTGTASTGVILLREIDPRFETMAASNLVYHQPWAMVFGFPMMLLMSFAPQSVTNALITLGVVVVLFALMMVINFRHRIFKKAYARKAKQ